MSDYVDVTIPLPNGKKGARATIAVSDPTIEPIYVNLPNGKKGALAVSDVNGGGGGTGGEGVASIDYKRGDNSTTYPNVDSLYIITTMEDGTITKTEIANVFTDVDYKLSIDPEKTRWDTQNQNLVLSNTDDTNINIPMDDLINFDYFSTEIAKLPDKNYVQNLSPVNIVESVVLISNAVQPTTNLFTMGLGQKRWTKSGDVYNLGPITTATSFVPNFRHVMRRHTYNLGSISNGNTTGVNILAFAPTVVVADNLVPENYVGGATPNADRLWTILPTSGLVNWRLEMNIRGTIGDSTDTDDVLILELWNGTQRTKVRTLTRAQLNDSTNPETSGAGVDIPFYTNGATDPMCIATGGFKVLLFNRLGANISDLQIDFRITR
jgi:hypothetical protein